MSRIVCCKKTKTLHPNLELNTVVQNIFIRPDKKCNMYKTSSSTFTSTKETSTMVLTII